MRIPFANLSRKIVNLLKKSEKGHRIRMTPYSTSDHIAIGTIDPTFSFIDLDESSQFFLLMDREQLARASNIDANYVSIPLKREVYERATHRIDENLIKFPKEQRKWKNQALAIPRQNPKREHRSKLSNEEQEELRELRRFKKQYHALEGAYIEMMMAGLVPMHEPPPFKLQHVQQVRYGCDWLSYEWKGKTLHLHWLETNLERGNKFPSLTRNERRFKEAIQSGKVVNEYHSMWIDGDGKNHWE